MRLMNLLGVAVLCVLTSTVAAQPVNDECLNATPVGEGTFPWDNTGSLVDGPNDCDGNMSGDVWFLYTATATAGATISGCGALGALDDSVLIVYDASLGCPVGGAACLASDDDSCANGAGGGAFMSSVSISVTAGAQYYVQIGGWNGSVGDSELIIELNEGDCFDGIDGDGDGLTDCADPECAAACVEVGNCNDGIDNDADGAIDCVDIDCQFDAICQEAGNCADGVDNDLDGDIDCVDIDCATDIACLPPSGANDECVNATPVGEGVFPWDNTVTPITGPTDCDANMSNDLWFLYTASSTADAVIETCGALGTMDDTTIIVYDGALGCPIAGSPFLACDDDSCPNAAGGAGFMSSVTVPVVAGSTYLVQVGGWNGTTGTSELIISLREGDCFDGLDGDGDGLTDCADPDCLVTCDESLNCADGIDNDSDGVIDCLDPDCAASADCIEAGNCADGIDNDLDGDIDCVDVDCATDAACDESQNCADGIDNDLDGDIDCADADCAVACVPPSTNDECLSALPVGEGAFAWNNTASVVDGPVDCDGNMSADVWFLYTASDTTNARIGTCGALGTMDDTTLIVYDAALGCPIAGSPCLAADDDTCSNAAGGPAFMSEVTIPVVAGGQYYVQVGGWNGTTGTSELSISLEIAPATNVTCTDTGASVDATWIPSSGGPGQDSQNIYVNGVLVSAAEPLTTTSWTEPYPAGFTGSIEICVETVFGTSTSDLACCSVGVGGPSNDNCANAIPLAVAVPEAGTLTLATNDGTASCGVSAANPDVWYSFTAPSDGTYLFATCGSNAISGIDTAIALFDTCGGIELGCDDDHGGLCVPSSSGLDSAIEYPMLAGDSVLLRVSHFGTAGIGGGDFTVFVEQDCGDLGVTTCTYNSAANAVDITWTDNPLASTGYEIFENGISIGTAPAGSNGFTASGPAPGANTYDVTWVCSISGAPGPVGSCSVTIVGGIPAGTTDVVINLDAQDGDTGLYDSGSAILGALAANGQTTYQVVAPEVVPLGLDFVGAGVSRVWVCTGSFPSDDRLTTTDGDFLANLNAIDGIGVYFEGGDHWGFAPVASGLDQRDGVTAALDGGDTLTSLSPIANGGVSDLSSAYPGTTGYTQNQAGNDWTDELTIGLGDPDVTVAEAMWENAATPGVVHTGYTEHTTGANMIVSSWHLGGFGGNVDALVATYSALLGGAPPPPTDPNFVRSDTNGDGSTNIADAIFTLGVLFPTGTPPTPQCQKALDANDDGGVNIADAIALLGVLFPSTSPPPTMPEPTTCGQDPTPDSLTCNSFAPCP